MISIRMALIWIIILSLATAGLIAYLFMSNTLKIDPDLAIIGLCINVTVAFTAILTLFIRKNKCPIPTPTK